MSPTFTLHDKDDEVLQWVRLYLHPGSTTPEETMDIKHRTWSAAEQM